jgi:hypothetical protein
MTEIFRQYQVQQRVRKEDDRQLDILRGAKDLGLLTHDEVIEIWSSKNAKALCNYVEKELSK